MNLYRTCRNLQFLNVSKLWPDLQMQPEEPVVQPRGGRPIPGKIVTLNWLFRFEELTRMKTN